MLTRNLALGLTGLLIWVGSHRFLQLPPSKATLFVAVAAALLYVLRVFYQDHVDSKSLLTTEWKVGAADVITFIAPSLLLAGVIW